jgi:hypothetical protein
MIDGKRIVLLLYFVLLALNFLWIPWRPPQTAGYYNLRDVQLRSGWIWTGPKVYVTDDFRYGSAARQATPGMSRILLRSLAILVFLPLVLRWSRLKNSMAP